MRILHKQVLLGRCFQKWAQRLVRHGIMRAACLARQVMTWKRLHCSHPNLYGEPLGMGPSRAEQNQGSFCRKMRVSSLVVVAFKVHCCKHFWYNMLGSEKDYTVQCIFVENKSMKATHR